MAANLQPISSDGGFTSGGNINLNGNLNLPLGSIVYETNIPDGALSGSAIALKPAGGTTANQQLLIYPTAADGDHIHMTSGNLYATELFLGSDNLYVKLANTGNVVINSNDGNSSNAMWTFGTDGSLTLPIGVSIDYNGNVQYPKIIADSGKLFSVQGQGNTGSAALAWTIDPNAASQYAAVAVTRAGGDDLAKVILTAQANSGDSANAKTWTFNEAGNLTLPGNTFAVNYANGTQVSIGGGSGNTGNVTFDDNIVIGTGDEFGSTGLFLAPGNGSIANSAVQYLRVRGGDAPTHIHLDTGNNQFYDQYFGDDAKYVKLELGDAGNVVIGTDDANGNQYSWSFTSDGNLILAGGNSVIQSIANSSSEPLYPNVSTMVFTPDALLSSQSLVLDPTGPSHIHLRAPGANIDEPDANIFLGGEASSFEVGYYNGNFPNLYIHSNNNTWTFGTDGDLTLPGNIQSFTTGFAFSSNISGVNTGSPTVLVTLVDPVFGAPETGQVTITGVVGTTEANNTWYFVSIDPTNFQLYTDATLTTPVNGTGWTAYVSGGLAVAAGYNNLNITGGNVSIQAGDANGTPTWNFDTAGNLTFPRDTSNVSTDPILSIVGGANPTILSTDASLAGPANLGMSVNWLNLSGADGNKIVAYPDYGILGADANVVLIADFANIGNSNISWTFDTTGNLTTPSNLVIGPTGLGSGTGFTQLDAPLLLGSSEANGGMSLVWYENPTGPGNVVQVGLNSSTPGSMTVTTGDLANTSYVWDFDNEGNLTLPSGGNLIVSGSIVSSGASPAPTLSGFSSVSALQFTNGNSNVTVNSNSNLWTFDSTGNLTLPANAFAINYANGTQVSLGGGNVTWAQIEDKDGNSGPTIITLGQNAGFDGQGNAAIAIGKNAGAGGQGASSITIGEDAGGNTTQGANAVAVGKLAGFDAQGIGAVAIGFGAGSNTQGTATVAIGSEAGQVSQGAYAVAVGTSAGSSLQGNSAVAIGDSAGLTSQGAYAVAVGYLAGETAQANNSIILNATGANLNQTTANTFTVAPVRNDTSNIAEVMFYNATSKEVTYGNTLSVAGNITGAYILGNGSGLTSLPIPTVTQDITSNGAMSIMTYDGNLKYVNNATVEPSSGNITGGNLITSGQITSTKAGNLSSGGGQLYLNGSGNNRIDFNTNGTGAPANTTRSAGTKITLYPSLSNSQTDYALGIDSGAFWSGVPAADAGLFFKWYAGTTEVANLSGTGILTVTGNIAGGNISTTGNLSAGNANVTGNINAGNIYATNIVAEAPFSIQSSNFSANAGGRYGVDTSAGAVTSTLPASPSTGGAIFFADAGGAFASNNLTINPNGQTIMGSAGNMTVSTNNQSFGLFFNGTTWRTYN